MMTDRHTARPNTRPFALWTVVVALMLGAAVLIAPLLAQQDSQKKNDPRRWEKAIAAFEARDKENPPPKDPVLFIGSSSIRAWKLADSFPDLVAINRGFGGSQIADSTYYADRIVHPYKPKLIVMYAGDNDVAAGLRPAEVFANYVAFVKAVRAKQPKTPIIYICIKPSLQRWKLWPQMQLANGLIRQYAQSDKLLSYADIATPMLGDDGKPRKELFRDDGLHLNKTGYEVWAKVIAPMIEAGVK